MSGPDAEGRFRQLEPEGFVHEDHVDFDSGVARADTLLGPHGPSVPLGIEAQCVVLTKNGTNATIP